MKREIDIIKDSRFSDNPMADVVKMSTEIEKNISDMAILTVYPIRQVNFDDCVSYRRTMIIEKRKGYKWDFIYGAINKTYAPYYKNVA